MHGIQGFGTCLWSDTEDAANFYCGIFPNSQADIDYFWNRLSEGMPADRGQCGWNALLQMKKRDIAKLQEAHNG
jgi:predicted 3-demethylubiquinone-9 3-methyltransferase (glyoxalase superfamily)